MRLRPTAHHPAPTVLPVAVPAFRAQQRAVRAVAASATRARSRRWLLPVAAFAALAVTVSLVVALTMAPALLLFAVLLRGHLPGEELLARLRARRAPRRSRRAPVHLTTPRLALVVRPVGRALASALAMRPPPRAAGA